MEVGILLVMLTVVIILYIKTWKNDREIKKYHGNVEDDKKSHNLK